MIIEEPAIRRKAEARLMEGHVPVMLEETLRLLEPERGGAFLDCTFGGGGHAEALLSASPAVALTALDRDPGAAKRAVEIARHYGERFRFRGINFSLLGVMEDSGFAGALFDLGVSSYQLDDPQRGFSLRADGPVDMRMDPRTGQSAHDFLETASREALIEAVRDWGEEPRYTAVVEAIQAARGTGRLSRTSSLAGLIAEAVGQHPKRGRTLKVHPATRTFQGLRMAVNAELQAIELALPEAFQRLAPGGVLAVISFHSLEDRLVKRFFRRMAGQAEHAGDAVPQQEKTRQAEILTRRPLRPTEAEVGENPRSRSARLRALRKLGLGVG